MPAKNYILAVTGLTNSIWICKPSITPGQMTSDRAKIDESDFIGIVLEWLNNKISDKDDSLEITQGGKVAATFTIDRVALGLRKSPPQPKAAPVRKKPKTATDVAKKLAGG